MTRNPSPPFANSRARNLTFAEENSAYNRAWFADLAAAAAAGAPLAFVNADVPTEIFKAMDLPVIVNQWWSAILAAKQKSAAYLGQLGQLGYRRSLCKYCALPFAGTLADDPDPPWGGLPRPSVLVSGNECGSLHAIFELWSARENIPLFRLDRLPATHPPAPGWLDRLRAGSADIFGEAPIAALADQYRELVAFLTQHTGATLDPARLATILTLANQQQDQYRITRDLISRTLPAPLDIADQMPATMIPQWHRGTEWARDRATLFRAETERRIEAGAAACPDERVRLMWLGTGLWYNLGFYEYFQAQHGAVFVWSIYTAIAADAYPTDDPDPFRALAARMTKIQSLLNLPPYSIEWFLREAQAAGIDGVVSLTGGTEDECRETFAFHATLRRRFAALGIPLLRLGADNTDPRSWDDQVVRERVSAFITDEILAKRKNPTP